MIQLDSSVPVQPRTIALCWHRDRRRSPAALGFVEAARAICKQVTAELDGKISPLVRRSRSA
jgi:DNA-binding transcriptional LysR family regulator